MDKQGYGSRKEIKEIAETVWANIASFGGYAFPKAHSTAYALIANATQYLKVKYPTEFFCAFLRQATDDEFNMIKNVSMKVYDVKYIMPKINLSKENFIIHDDKIVWSLTSIKGIGSKAAAEIISKQPFDSFEDFFNRVNKRVVNVKVVRTLIIANVFKEFGNRNKISKLYAKLRNDLEYPIMGKNDWDLQASKIIPYFKQSVKDLFPDKMGAVMSYQKFLDTDIGNRVVVAGFIGPIRDIQTKRGIMIIMNIIDASDSYTVICWNDMYKRLLDKKINLSVGMAIKVSGIKSLSQFNKEQITLGREASSYVKVLK